MKYTFDHYPEDLGEHMLEVYEYLSMIDSHSHFHFKLSEIASLSDEDISTVDDENIIEHIHTLQEIYAQDAQLLDNIRILFFCVTH